VFRPRASVIPAAWLTTCPQGNLQRIVSAQGLSARRRRLYRGLVSTAPAWVATHYKGTDYGSTVLQLFAYVHDFAWQNAVTCRPPAAPPARREFTAINYD